MGVCPEGVWEYTLGGYQVLKKWLSYREREILGRQLHESEARDFMLIARRIAALLALGDALNASYHMFVSQRMTSPPDPLSHRRGGNEGGYRLRLWRYGAAMVGADSTVAGAFAAGLTSERTSRWRGRTWMTR